MSKNTYLGANVITTDTFAGWIDKTNQVRDDMGRIVVTVTTSANAEPNTTNAGLTTGNLAIQGVVTANTIAVSSALRGGTVITSGDLTISSNALFTTTGNVEFTAANNINIDANNLILSSNVTFDGGVTKNIRIDTANTTVNTGAFFVNSNSVFSSNVTMTGANTTIGDAGTDILNVVAAPTFTANATFTSNVLISGANTNLTGTMTVGNLVVTGTTSLASNVSFFVNTATANTSTVFSVFESQGNTVLGDTSADRLVVNANTLFSSNVTISGTTTVGTLIANSKTIAVGGNITTANSLTTSGNFALTLTQTGATNVTLPTTGTLATTGNLAQFAATTSAQLRSVISDETGSGSLVFGTSPTLTTPTLSDATLDGTTSISGNMTVTGNLTINGTTTTINSTTLTVDDKNIELGSVTTPTDLTANGGGITLKGDTDKTINWLNTTDAWTSSEDFNLLTGNSYKINNVTVLSATALGTGITDSELTSVGTLTSGTWNATTIATSRGGTGQTTYTNGQLLIGNTSSGSLVKATLTAANNVTITNGAGSISIAANPDLSYTTSSASGTVNISGSGTSATIPAANSTVAGLMTNGTQTIAGAKTFSSTISGSINGNADTVTDGVYLSGTQTITGNKTFTGTMTTSSINFDGTGTITAVANQAQAEAGTSNTLLMTPARTRQAIVALTPPTEMALLGTLTTTSGTTRTLSGLDLTPYRYVELVFRAISITQSVSREIRIGTARFMNAGESESQVIRGLATIYLGDGTFISNWASNSSSGLTGGLTASTTSGTCGITNSDTSISATVDASGVFDGGSITFFGVY